MFLFDFDKICLNYFIIFQVQHSQRLNAKPLEVWVIAETGGTVKSAHCTCIAGLSESCSHVAALLFYVEDLVRKTERKTVTDMPAYWTAPSKQIVKYAKVEDIDFSTPIRQLRKSFTVQNTVPRKTQDIPEMNDNEFMNFLTELKSINPQAGILNVVKPFCESNATDIDYPLDLASLFDQTLLSQPLGYLQKKALDINITVSPLQANNIFKNTVRQASSSLWHKHRVGRITASKFKAVCSTALEKPALSLIKAICYPNKVKLTTKAVKWGCKHEETALKQYSSAKGKDHLNFEVCKSGLIISNEYPFFGASPDGLITCDCCGEGCLEIKCPYCLKGCSKEDVENRSSCLETVGNRTFLKRDHSYFYQVQAQLGISGRKYCDFVLWTEKSLFVERISFDDYFWQVNAQSAKTFFHLVILPELMGKYFTRNKESLQDAKQLQPMIVHLNN